MRIYCVPEKQTLLVSRERCRIDVALRAFLVAGVEAVKPLLHLLAVFVAVVTSTQCL